MPTGKPFYKISFEEELGQSLISWGYIPRPLGRKRVKETALLIPRFRGTRKASDSERACPGDVYLFHGY